jgi:hypothetical protein
VPLAMRLDSRLYYKEWRLHLFHKSLAQECQPLYGDEGILLCAQHKVLWVCVPHMEKKIRWQREHSFGVSKNTFCHRITFICEPSHPVAGAKKWVK